jgi:DNA-binding response OmpR family regulator
MAKKRILCIDDDPDTLNVVNFILSEEGYSVEILEYLPQIKQISDYKPDIILLDEWLKEGTGSGLCKQIKLLAKHKGFTIILLSAVNGLEQIARDCGADYFIQKPFDIDYLLKAIKMLL